MCDNTSDLSQRGVRILNVWVCVSLRGKAQRCQPMQGNLSPISPFLPLPCSASHSHLLSCKKWSFLPFSHNWPYFLIGTVWELEGQIMFLEKGNVFVFSFLNPRCIFYFIVSGHIKTVTLTAWLLCELWIICINHDEPWTHVSWNVGPETQKRLKVFFFSQKPNKCFTTFIDN